MTISPPANTHWPVPALKPDEPARPLAHGIDTLELTVDMHWRSDVFLQKLEQLKDQAACHHQPQPAVAIPDYSLGTTSQPWTFEVAPSGTSGYRWLLQSGELTMKIANTLEANPRRTRPPITVEVRSAMLWACGPHAVVERIRALIEGPTFHGVVHGIEASRVDLCVDLLIRKEEWHDAVYSPPYINQSLNRFPVF